MAINRRNFLKTLGGATLLTIVPRHVLGGSKFIAPSDQLTKGIIGVGGIGKSKHHFTSDDRCRLVAVCDVDAKHLKSAVELGRKKFNQTLQAYSNYRDLIADPNVDIVHIATPPHWHGIMAVEAARAGKDIWCEKPMTRTIGESRRVVEAVKRNNRIFRLNTWFRFKDTFYGLGTTIEPLKKLVDSGLLGWPLKVTISGTTGFTWKFYWVGKENLDKALKAVKGKDKAILTFMFLFPFFPDDILCFVSGLSSMSTGFFIIMITITRFISIFISCFASLCRARKMQAATACAPFIPSG